jgi:hypothetical protein
VVGLGRQCRSLAERLDLDRFERRSLADGECAVRWSFPSVFPRSLERSDEGPAPLPTDQPAPVTYVEIQPCCGPQLPFHESIMSDHGMVCPEWGSETRSPCSYSADASPTIRTLSHRPHRFAGAGVLAGSRWLYRVVNQARIKAAWLGLRKDGRTRSPSTGRMETPRRRCRLWRRTTTQRRRELDERTTRSLERNLNWTGPGSRFTATSEEHRDADVSVLPIRRAPSCLEVNVSSAASIRRNNAAAPSAPNEVLDYRADALCERLVSRPPPFCSCAYPTQQSIKT